MGNEKMCPLMTIAKAQLNADCDIDGFKPQGCFGDDCRWWLGDTKNGDCAVNFIAGLTDETFQVSLV